MSYLFTTYRLAVLKFGLILWLLSTLAACNEAEVTELVFRKTLEFQLSSECQDLYPDNNACGEAVTAQIKSCMEKASWKDYVAKKDDETAQQQFIVIFFPCFVDEQGQSYF